MIKSLIILYLLYTIQAPLGWKIVAYVVLAWELSKVVRNMYLFCRGFRRRWKALQAAKKITGGKK